MELCRTSAAAATESSTVDVRSTICTRYAMYQRQQQRQQQQHRAPTSTKDRQLLARQNKIAAAMTMAFSVPAASVTPACCRQRSRESLAADSISGARLSASNSAEALVEGWLLKTPNHFQHKIREALRKRGRAGGWSFSSRTKDTRANHLPCACWAFT